MNERDALALLFERGNAVQTFWNAYITVSLAMIAFFGSTESSDTLKAAMSLGFVVFAIANGGGMFKAARERYYVHEVFEETIASSGGEDPIHEVGRVSKPLPPLAVAAAHVLMDTLVLGSMWLPGWLVE